MSTVDTARDLLESRRDELKTELAQIDSALASLRGTSESKPKAARNGARAGRGQRRQQVLDYLGENSNAKPGEIARAIGVQPAQVSNLIRALRNEKLVRKTRGGGYSLSKAGVRPTAE